MFYFQPSRHAGFGFSKRLCWKTAFWPPKLVCFNCLRVLFLFFLNDTIHPLFKKITKKTLFLWVASLYPCNVFTVSLLEAKTKGNEIRRKEHISAGHNKMTDLFRFANTTLLVVVSWSNNVNTSHERRPSWRCFRCLDEKQAFGLLLNPVTFFYTSQPWCFCQARK